MFVTDVSDKKGQISNEYLNFSPTSVTNINKASKITFQLKAQNPLNRTRMSESTAKLKSILVTILNRNKSLKWKVVS